MTGKVFIKGYNSAADAEDNLQSLNVQLHLRVSVRDNAMFVDEFLVDLQKFIDKKYKKIESDEAVEVIKPEVSI